MKRTAILLMTMLMVIVCALGVSACVPDDANGKDYIVTVLCGEGGTYTLSEESPVPENVNETLTVTPNENYEINEVTLNGAKIVLNDDNTYTFTVIEDTTITISFKKTTDDHNDPNDPATKTKYTVSVDCGENGDYEITKEGAVEENTEVTLTVTPNENYEVNQVKVNGKVVDLTDNKYTFTVTEDTTITISFKKTTDEPTKPNDPNDPALAKYTVSVDCNKENGDYEITKEGEVEKDTEVTLTLKPDENYEAEVKVNGEVVELTDNTYTFTVDKDIAITITFKATEAQEPSDRHEHTYEWTMYGEPSTTVGALEQGICKGCSEETPDHQIEIELPDLTDERYIKTNDTATCTDNGTAHFAIDIDGYHFEFDAITISLGHNLDANGYCNRCKQSNVGIFDSKLIGTWQSVKAVGYTDKILEIGKNTVKYNGKDGTNIRRDVTDDKELMYYFYIKNEDYVAGDDDEESDDGGYVEWSKREYLEYNIVVHIGNIQGGVYYLLEINYKLSTSNISVSYQLYNDAYPINFPSNIQGSWKGDYGSISFGSKSFKFAGETIFIRRYMTTSTGFYIEFNSKDEMSPDWGYCLEYTASTNTIEISENYAGAEKHSYTKNSSSSGGSSSGVGGESIPESRGRGTYVSDDSKYTIVVDDNGKITFNGAQVTLTKIDIIYWSFTMDNVVYTISFSTAAPEIWLTAASLGIEKVVLTKVE